MRRLLVALFSAAVIAFLPSPAFAHAALDRSQPGDGAIVTPAPAAVQLWFTKALEPSFSTVRVVDQTGKQVDSGKPAVSGSDPKLLEVGLPSLATGIYKVIWKIVALDGHKAKGEFSFTVK